MRLAAFITTLGLGTLAALSTACTTATDDAATNDGAEQEVKAAVFTESDNGKTVDVALGQDFTIALSSNASTGYRWKVTRVDRSLGYPTETTVPGDVNRPGSPGEQRFTWSTSSPLSLAGKHAIELEYQRPWAETAPPAKTFSLTVNIVDPANEPKNCGGFAGLQCDPSQYCHYTETQSCGFADQMGTCETAPEVCYELYHPVCGCDGQDYQNDCFANAAGTSVAHDGTCSDGGAADGGAGDGGAADGGVACGDTTCAAGEVCCNPLMGICTKPGMFCIQ